jgi:transposase
MRVRPTYSDQFKSDAVALLVSTDRSLPQVADDLGVSRCSLRGWYNASLMAKRKKKARAPSVSRTPEAETPKQRIERLERELAAARKENESLKMDREILKKAAAFFAKENE